METTKSTAYHILAVHSAQHSAHEQKLGKSGVSNKRKFNEHHTPFQLSVGWVWLKGVEIANAAVGCLLPSRS